MTEIRKPKRRGLSYIYLKLNKDRKVEFQAEGSDADLVGLVLSALENDPDLHEIVHTAFNDHMVRKYIRQQAEVEKEIKLHTKGKKVG